MRDGFITVAVATPEVAVADCAHNAQATADLIAQAADRGVKVLVLPELGLTAYTCGDLFLQPTLLRGAEAALETVLEATKGKDLVVICGGTGMAPVKTMLNHFCDHPEEINSLYLIAGFKDINCVLFTEELEKFTREEKFHAITSLDSSSAPGFETGMVTAHISKVPFRDFADYNVAIVGPPVMMHFAALECLKNGAVEDKIWVSFERKMSCAVGKCGHCKINETYVCLEGPVFNYSRAKNLFD